MKNPHKTTGESPVNNNAGHIPARADYSANPSLALNVPAECAGMRLDQALAKLCPQHSRSRLQHWIREGRVRLAGEVLLETRHKLWGGETLELVEGVDERAQAAQAEAIELDIVFEDAALIIIDKPAGLVVHPGSGNWSGTLQNALLHHAPQLENVPRAGIVHRLD